jgi:hypothetical protein
MSVIHDLGKGERRANLSESSETSDDDFGYEKTVKSETT